MFLSSAVTIVTDAIESLQIDVGAVVIAVVSVLMIGVGGRVAMNIARKLMNTDEPVSKHTISDDLRDHSNSPWRHDNGRPMTKAQVYRRSNHSH